MKNRITELKYVRAGDLLPSPHNWRRHPDSQRSALRGVLEKIGYADALLARRVDDKLELIDGHLRKEITPPDEQVPVLVLDLDENEARTLIAAFDPLSAMAETDEEELKKLLSLIDIDNDALREELERLAKIESPELKDEPDLRLMSIWGVYVDCESEEQQIELLDRLIKEGYKCRSLIL